MTSSKITPAILAALVATGSILTPARAFGQEDSTARRALVADFPFAERSRILRNVPNTETGEIYEAWLGVHFLLGGSMQGNYDAAVEKKTPGWAFLPSFTMAVNVRQLEVDSAPVRTPSFMPRLRATAARSAPPKRLTTTGQWVFDGSFGHYSNGQEGCTFERQDRDRECAFVQPVPVQDLKANELNGSFSSHYLEAAAGHRWITWGDVLLPNGRVPSLRVIGVYLRVRDYELVSRVPGGLKDEVKDLYGSLRIRGGLDASFEDDGDKWYSGPYWFGGWAEHSNGSRVGKVRWSAEAGKGLNSMNGVGFFLRAYSGHDDYNIRFLRDIFVAQVGLSIGGERRPTFRP